MFPKSYVFFSFFSLSTVRNLCCFMQLRFWDRCGSDVKIWKMKSTLKVSFIKCVSLGSNTVLYDNPYISLRTVFLGEGGGSKSLKLIWRQENTRRKTSRGGGSDLSIQILQDVFCERPLSLELEDFQVKC
jgi:hypothetical protein